MCHACAMAPHIARQRMSGARQSKTVRNVRRAADAVKLGGEEKEHMQVGVPP
jgi:hypothetical protein